MFTDSWCQWISLCCAVTSQPRRFWVLYNTVNTNKRISTQGGHSPGKVGDFQSGHGKVRETQKSQGKLKSESSYSPTTTDTTTDIGVIYCVILHLLQPQCIKCQILKAQWLPGLLLINMKQRLTIMLNSISMNLCLPYWKSQGISCSLENGHPVNWRGIGVCSNI